VLREDLDADDDVECAAEGPDGVDGDGFRGDETDDVERMGERVEVAESSSLSECAGKIGI